MPRLHIIKRNDSETRENMDYLPEIIKGIFIGAGAVLPGISGGTLALSMGVYEKIIYAVTHLHREPRKSMLLLAPYILGAAAGMIGLSFIIEYLFSAFPLETSAAFLGMIFSGIPAIWKRITGSFSSMKRSHMATLFFLTFLITAMLPFLSAKAIKNAETGVLSLSALPCFLIGIMSAGTLVIPGISGSMILMMLGYYQPLLSAVNHTLAALFTWNLKVLLLQAASMAPFGAGLFLGLLLFANLMETLFAKFEPAVCCSILGLILSSPISIFAEVPGSRFTAYHTVSAAVCFLAAISVSLWFCRADT